MADKSSSPPAPEALTEPEPSYSPSVSEDEIAPEPLPRLRRRNETADVDAVAMLLGLSQCDDDVTSSKPRNGSSNRPKRPLTTANATAGFTSKNFNMTKKGVTRMAPGDNRVRPPKAATKLLPEAKWRHIRLPDVQSALEAEDIVVLWGHYKFPEALPRHKAEGHLNFVWRHYKDGSLKILLEPIQSAFELENFLKDRYGVGTSTKKPRTNGGTSNTTSGNPNLPSLPPAQATAAVIGALPPMCSGGGGVEKKRPLSQQPSGYERHHHQQQQHHYFPTIQPSNSNGDDHNEGIGKGINKQSSKEMAGLLYIGAGLTEDQEIDTKEPAAENGGSGNESGEDNSLDKPSIEVKQEEGEEKNQPAAPAAIGQQQQQPGGDISQQQQQLQQQADLPIAAAVTNANGGAVVATSNGDPAAAAAAAANTSVMDPTTASFLAAAAANGMHMPPGLSFPGMLHPAWGNLLANPIAWQLAGGGGGDGLPSSNNGNGTRGEASTAANGNSIPLQMEAMFPGLQFPGAFNQLAALGGYSNIPSLHPSTAAAAAAAAAAAGIDPTGFVQGVSAPSAAPSPPPRLPPPLPSAAAAAAAAQEGAAIIANKGNTYNEGAGGKYNTGDRPGRPPSYDIMVRWCVNLKRCLWQRHVPLTIEEAVTMVNDPALCARPPALSEKSRVLVASTLRKRVLGIYKITWSQIATDADPGLHDEVVDPSVHAAAGIKLKRHGMEPARTPNNTSNRPVVTGAGASGAAVHGVVNGVGGVPPGMMPPHGLLANNNNNNNSPDDPSVFAMVSAPSAAAATGGANAAASGKIEVKKEEDLASTPLGNNGTDRTMKSMSEVANAACEAAFAAAAAAAAASATQPVLHQGNSNGCTTTAVLPPTLPPMSSSLDHLRNAMGLEIEVKELSPGAADITVPPPTVKDMVNLMQQQQQDQQQQMAPGAVAQNNTVLAADGVTPIPTGGATRKMNTTDLPSIDSLEKALNNTTDGLDGLNNPEAGQDGGCGAGINAQTNGGKELEPTAFTAKELFRTKFITVDPSDADGMFGAMCGLHQIAGITKQECAAICRLWLENVLNDNQKRQLFMYIKANIKEEDLVADWVKSFIRKHGG